MAREDATRSTLATQALKTVTVAMVLALASLPVRAATSPADTALALGDPRLIVIGDVPFDPLVTGAIPPGTTPELTALQDPLVPAGADSTRAPTLIQFTGSAAAFRTQIEKLGVRVMGFVPNAAWLVRRSTTVPQSVDTSSTFSPISRNACATTPIIAL